MPETLTESDRAQGYTRIDPENGNKLRANQMTCDEMRKWSAANRRRWHKWAFDRANRPADGDWTYDERLGWLRRSEKARTRGA